MGIASVLARITLVAACAAAPVADVYATEARQAPSSAAAPGADRLFSDAELRAVYAQPPSRFISIDGVPFHVREEGRGPPLILINGQIGRAHV